NCPHRVHWLRANLSTPQPRLRDMDAECAASLLQCRGRPQGEERPAHRSEQMAKAGAAQCKYAAGWSYVTHRCHCPCCLPRHDSNRSKKLKAQAAVERSRLMMTPYVTADRALYE